MPRRKTYQFRTRCEQIILSLIPSEKPAARYNQVFRETTAQVEQEFPERHFSKSTFSEYFRGLSSMVVKDQDGGYRRDSKFEEILYGNGIMAYYVRGSREELVGDPWKDIPEDSRQIELSINTALIRYLVNLSLLMQIGPKAAARDFIEQRMRLDTSYLFNRASAIAWKNRRKIAKEFEEIIRQGPDKFGSLHLSFSGPSVDGHR